MCILIRACIKKEIYSRLLERFAIYSHARRTEYSKLIWIHAVSVGELMSVHKFLHIAMNEMPEAHFLVTTNTTTSCNIFEQFLKKDLDSSRIIHKFLPFDHYIILRKFYNFWNPNTVILIESEIWPGIIHEASLRKIPIFLLNARISKNSYQLWSRFSIFARSIFSKITICIAQNKTHGKRLYMLGVKEISYGINIKYDSNPLGYEQKRMNNLVKSIKQRNIWLAASTHYNEEEIVINTHQKLELQFGKKTLTILCVRHIHRIPKIIELCNKYSVKYQLSSQTQDVIQNNISFYIIDEMGMLGLYYRVTNIAFIGGSFVDVGGHNIIEAAKLECAILYGPFMYNFQDVANDFEHERASIRVESQDELFFKLKQLFEDPESCDRLAKKAFALVKSKEGGTLDLFKQIQKYL